MKVYGWNQVEQEQLNPHMGRQAIHGVNTTVARIELKKDAKVQEHHHINEQITMVERGSIKFFFDGREQILKAGDILVIPPNAPHGVEALEDCLLLDIFSPGREDWIRGDDAYLRK